MTREALVDKLPDASEQENMIVQQSSSSIAASKEKDSASIFEPELMDEGSRDAPIALRFLEI